MPHSVNLTSPALKRGFFCEHPSVLHKTGEPRFRAGAPGGLLSITFVLGSVSLPGGAACRNNLEKLKPFRRA